MMWEPLYDRHGVRVLDDDPFADDMDALTDERADERMDSPGWRADALDEETHDAV